MPLDISHDKVVFFLGCKLSLMCQMNTYMFDTFLSDLHIWQVSVPPVAAKMVAAELRNIFVLGTSFLLIFTGFHTIALLQTLDNGVKSPRNSLAVVYVVFGVTCISAPCLLSLLGHRSF